MISVLKFVKELLKFSFSLCDLLDDNDLKNMGFSEESIRLIRKLQEAEKN